MGHIGYKFISGFIQCLHTGKHLIKCVSNQRRLCIIRNGNLLILITVCQILDGFGNSCKWLHKYSGKHISKKRSKHNDNSCDQNALLLQFLNILSNLIGRKADQHSSLKLLHLRTLHRNRHLNFLCFVVIAAGFLAFEALDHHTGDQCLAFIYAISILDNPVVPVNQQNSAIIYIRQQLQLAVHILRAGVIHIIFFN